MVKTILVFFIILFVFSMAGAIFPIFVRITSIFDVIRYHFGYGLTMKKWEQQSYFRRFIGTFLVGTIIGLISFGIGYYHDRYLQRGLHKERRQVFGCIYRRGKLYYYECNRKDWKSHHG